MSTDQPTSEPLPAGSSSTSIRFTLRELFILTTLVCVSGGLFAWMLRAEPSVFLLFLMAAFGTVAYFVHFLTRWSMGNVLALSALISCLGVCLLLPATSRDPGPKALCTNQLRNITLALLQYHDAFGQFPPAYIADENGRPMHSWRVLILPYLEKYDLYHQYRFDEPWDGPNNSLLHKEFIRYFSCPSVRPWSTDTCYMAVVGSQTAWPGSQAVRLGDIKDGENNTILLVEVKNSRIHWMEPRDLDMSQMSPSMNAATGPCICSNHKGGAFVAFADASVRFLPDTLPFKTLRALLTRSGGETVNLP